MKILHVNKYYATSVGGIETVIRNIVDGLQKNGFENEVVTCDLGPSRMSIVDGVRVYYAHAIKVIKSVPISFSFFWYFFKGTKKSDVVFIHHPFPPASLAYLIFGRNKPLFIWYHSDVVRQKIINYILGPIIRASMRRAQKIFVSNKHIVTQSPVLKNYQSKCVVVPFGINICDYQKTDAIERASLDIKKKFGTPIILSVGRLVHYKGFSYLIEAMKGIEAHLIIIGKGKLYRALMKQIKDLGLDDRITIIQEVVSPIPFYAASDFVVFPSIYKSETFGLVQLEAMASGKPVINTNVHPGVCQISLHGVTGLTVAKEDSAALHEAIKKMLTDQQLKEEFGANALERVRVEFSMQNFVKKVGDNLINKECR